MSKSTTAFNSLTLNWTSDVYVLRYSLLGTLEVVSRSRVTLFVILVAEPEHRFVRTFHKLLKVAQVGTP